VVARAKGEHRDRGHTRERRASHRAEPFALGLTRLLMAIGDPDHHGAQPSLDARGDPHEVETLILRGQLEESQQRPEAALRAFAQAVALAPEHPLARLHLGRLLCELGNDREAIEELEAAVALAPRSIEPLYALAVAHIATDRTREAIAALRRTIEIDKNFLDGYLNLAELLTTVGRLDDADALLARARRRFPTTGVVYDKIAGLRLRQGDIRGVVAALRAQVSVDTRNEQAYVSLVTFSLAANDVESAVTAVDELLTRHPQSWRGYYLRSILYDLADRPDRAITDLRRALRLAPEQWQPLNDLGLLLCAEAGARGEHSDEGVQLLRSASARAPTDELAPRYNLGLAYLAAGQQAAARRTVNDMVQRGPDDHALVARARTLIDDLEAA